tara:strand:- start:1921 stop:2340 length:420 start_codon:yes stop_codon:yes gene_type:complete
MEKDGMMIHRDPIVCANGLRLSVQASRGHDCLPQDMEGPYTHVEVYVESPKITDDQERAFSFEWICGLAAGELPATSKMLAFIDHGGIAFGMPAVSVLEVIRENGGAVEGELPPIDLDLKVSNLWGMNAADPDGKGRGL